MNVNVLEEFLVGVAITGLVQVESGITAGMQDTNCVGTNPAMKELTSQLHKQLQLHSAIH